MQMFIEISSSLRDRHGMLLVAAVKHRLTITDIRTNHIDQVFPVLRKAKPVDVPEFKKELRTKLARRPR